MQLLTFSKSLNWCLTVINGTVFDLSRSTLKYWGYEVYNTWISRKCFVNFFKLKYLCNYLVQMKDNKCIWTFGENDWFPKQKLVYLSWISPKITISKSIQLTRWKLSSYFMIIWNILKQIVNFLTVAFKKVVKRVLE